MYWGTHDGMGWWMLFGGVIWVIFLGSVIYLAAMFSRGSSGGAADHGRETPLEIARRRYAAGEISEEEFQRLKANLER